MKHLAILAVILMVGCRGMPSERASYKAACEAVRATAGFPENAHMHPFRQTRIGLGKNAGRVDVNYDFKDEHGQNQTATYIVWVKRVARRWEVDRLQPAPRYP